MFEDSGFCDEVIITAGDETYREIFGKQAIVLQSERKEDGIWLSAYVDNALWKVRAADTVPTGRRVSAALAG